MKNGILHSSLLKYIVKRLLMAVFVLILVSIIVFVTVRLCPGDPVLAKIGPHGDNSSENYARIATELGLDKPMAVQYLIWLRDFVRGDFGKSLLNGKDVRPIVMEKLPPTIELVVVSMVFAILLAIVLGVTSAIHKDTWYDQLVRFISTGNLAIPNFCVALILILLLCVHNKVFPSRGYVSFHENPVMNLRYMFLPCLTLVLNEQASLTRYIRSEMLEILGSNYVRTAKAKGLPRSGVYYRHAFKNVLVTVITLVGMRLGQLAGGAVILEQMFSWSGVGWLLYSSIVNQDYPAVQAVVLIIAAIMVLCNMISDILYAAVDPRIKLD